MTEQTPTETTPCENTHQPEPISSQSLVAAQQLTRQLYGRGLPEYINDILDKDTNLPTGYRSITHSIYAKHLKKIFNIVNFKKQLYIYDKKERFYKMNVNELETHMQETCARYNVSERLHKVQQEMKAQLYSMGNYSQYPFDMEPNLLPVENGVIKISYKLSYVDMCSYIEMGFNTISTPKSGVVRIPRFELLPHNPKYLFTFKLPIKYNPKMDKQLALNVICQWIDEPKVNAYVQIPAQAILQKHMKLPFKKAYMLQGEPNAGKTTAISLLQMFFGEIFCGNANLSQLCSDRFVGGYLEGKLMNIYDDLEDVPLESVGEFKTITGSNTGSVQRKGKDAYTGRITAVHLFSCNRPPSFPKRVEEDSAFWERWEYINFSNTFVVNPQITQILFTDDFMSAFLNLVLDAMINIENSGRLLVVSNAQDVMERWIIDSDPILEFIEWGFGQNVSGTQELYSKEKTFLAYQKFCVDHNINEKKQKKTLISFTQSLQKRGFLPYRHRFKGENFEVYSTTHYRVKPEIISDIDWKSNINSNKQIQ